MSKENNMKPLNGQYIYIAPSIFNEFINFNTIYMIRQLKSLDTHTDKIGYITINNSDSIINNSIRLIITELDLNVGSDITAPITMITQENGYFSLIDENNTQYEIYPIS